MDEKLKSAQPTYRGWPLVLATVMLAVTITVLPRLPVPEAPRRWLVLGLLVAMVAVQAALGVQVWRAGRRPLSPWWMQAANQAGWLWGFYTGGYAIPVVDEDTVLSRATFGAVVVVVFAMFVYSYTLGRPSENEQFRSEAGLTTDERERDL